MNGIMKIKIFQKGFNYSEDGIGNRLVYHLQGCNMRCPWCANPEGMPVIPPLVLNEPQLLDSVCPYGAIINGSLDRSFCKSCASRDCITIHKNLGITCKCEEYEIDDLVNEVKSCSPMFFDNGGITLTGGEPTIQFEAVFELLTKLKKAGIHTAMETNGTHRRLSELFVVIDQLMMDFKHYNSEIHKVFTGVSNETIKANMEKAADMRRPLFVRIPLINGFNASVKDIQHFIDFLKSMNTSLMSFEFLSYHEYGKEKWKQCGAKYEMRDAFVSAETVKAFEQAFAASGLHIIRT